LGACSRIGRRRKELREGGHESLKVHEKVREMSWRGLDHGSSNGVGLPDSWDSDFREI
jgi:hypothetical protein